MIEDFIEGSDPGLAIASENQITPAAVAFSQDAKTIVVTQERAREVAENSGIRFEGLGGTEGGVIGAIAGVALASLKNDGRFLLKGRNRELSGIRSVQEIINAGIDQVLTLQGKTITGQKNKDSKKRHTLIHPRQSSALRSRKRRRLHGSVEEGIKCNLKSSWL